MLPIYREMNRCAENGIRGVLGTIIRTEGSTYQKEGTKCFWAEDGKLTGLLSGGCVEGDLAEHAREVLDHSSCKTLAYDFRDKGDDLWGLGLGCNGSIDILLEPFDPVKLRENTERTLELYESALNHETILRTIIEAETPSLKGKKWVVAPNMDHVKSGLDTVAYENEKVLVFTEKITPSPRLTLFGAGPDAVPLVNGAKQLNWHITIIDHRPSFVNTQNFPQADQLLCVPKGKWQDPEIGNHSFVVTMTHHFDQDLLLLEHILETDAAYIGVLGPNKRTYELMDRLGKKFHEDRLSRLYSPIGLDIGAKTPEEIALSILAEMVMVHRGKGSGQSLQVMKKTSFTKYLQTKVGELAF
ncbi:XdhC family protein [Fictibacillus terranigra]|uniref:XdhC family protein n=1 Tax=Fictibacillus terranigra TaxID=3058424 RepID=A0ABT8E5E1_9BACL|nr:XdhC/CoxI family protein [Fictibacillus sp. CENA-BCM004]MDN4073111.1 XdhC family protein [Fictibacillus sp. CENA-BCM004]